MLANRNRSIDQLIKVKRQQYTAGAVVRIPLTDGRNAFGRLLAGKPSTIMILSLIVDNNEKPNKDVILASPPLFTVVLYLDVITKGKFEIIRTRQSGVEAHITIPAFFSQDMVNPEDCRIFWPDGREIRASPEECVGLERGAVWDAEAIVQRIEDHINARKNFNVELFKVILNKEDPRYLAPPGMLKWNFSEGKFYRGDR
jgi:hypothetical protein